VALSNGGRDIRTWQLTPQAVIGLAIPRLCAGFAHLAAAWPCGWQLIRAMAGEPTVRIKAV